MKTEDHKLLACNLVKKCFKNISSVNKNMFILGSVSPDYNPFTYIKGTFRYQSFKGHNFLNCKSCIKKYLDKLSKSDGLSEINYYYLGRVIHYICDSFTFVHNKEFNGTIKQHLKYEYDMHNKFIKGLSINLEDKIYLKNIFSCEGIYASFLKAHTVYINKRRNMENDISYIYLVAEIVINQILYPAKQRKIEENVVAIKKSFVL